MIFAGLFWLLRSAIKRDYSKMKDFMISTIVILLFIVHPDITMMMFMAFNCIKVEGKYYLTSDVTVTCYEGTHKFYSLVIVVPSLIIWVMGIPMFALYLLIKNKKHIIQLDRIERYKQQKGYMLSRADSKYIEKASKEIIKIKEQFGFIFAGYDLNHFYWEIIIQYRKIGLIMVSVFLTVISPEV